MGRKRREEKQLKRDEDKLAKKRRKQSDAANDLKEIPDAEAEQTVDPERLDQVVKSKNKEEKRLIVVLESANLETVKWSSKGFGLLNVDEHASILRKHGRDFSQARPDITHQCLLMLLDSPLNRAGLLQVFIRTANNVLIEINPQMRIPRTFNRFAGLIVQLLHKFSIKAVDSSVKLMKVIKNPVSDHLPVGCRKVLMSYSAEKVVKAQDIAKDVDEPICVVIGAVAKGKIEVDYTEEEFCIGNYPLSAALTCTKLTSAFEDEWNVF